MSKPETETMLVAATYTTTVYLAVEVPKGTSADDVVYAARHIDGGNFSATRADKMSNWRVESARPITEDDPEATDDPYDMTEELIEG